MSVRLKRNTFLLKQLPLLRPSGDGASDRIDNPMAGIDRRRAAEDMAHQTGMARRIDKVGYLPVAHNSPAGDSRDDAVDGITENCC